MKYKAIIEDTQLLDNVNMTELSKHLNMDASNLYKIKRGGWIISETLYLKIKNAIEIIS